MGDSIHAGLCIGAEAGAQIGDETRGVCVPEISLVSRPNIDSETGMCKKTGFSGTKRSSEELTTLGDNFCGDRVAGGDMLLYEIFIAWDIQSGTELLKIGMVSTRGSKTGTADPKQIWLGDDDTGETDFFPSSV